MLKTGIHVERDLHIAAPEGDAIYACAGYTETTGASLLETVRHEGLGIFAKRIYQRRSEDNGLTWAEEPDEDRADPEHIEGAHRYPPRIILDQRNNLLISLYCTYEIDPADPQFAIGSRQQRTYRTFYQLSHDGGRTWGASQQVIDARDEFNDTNWAPGVEYGVMGGIADGQHVFLPDGTLVIGFDVAHPEAPPGDTTPRALECYETVVYAQARLTALPSGREQAGLTGDGTALEWRFGEMIAVEYPKATGGCCEAALAWLGGTGLFNTMRCQGDEASGIYSTRYTTVSGDGGLTWSEPKPLVYDDGSIVWTPASVHQFFPSSKTGKTYLLANILPGPVHAQTPRYPLTIAEFDTERLCVLRNTVQVIQDLPEGAPKERRYTNWGLYEERGSGDLIMTMPEQPKHTDFSAMTKPEDFTADCIRFRIRFDG